MGIHEHFMHRCIELASLSMGHTLPNPMVGAVLVYGGRIIAEGYHRGYGKAHAEVDCLQRLPEEHQHWLREATLYVNLEPCSHHGKTPPCADRIIELGIAHVVIGATDPNPIVAGRGIQKIVDAGITVTMPVMEQTCIKLNKRFYTFHEQKRPYIVLKWAQSSDGFIAPIDNASYWLTGDYARTLVHQWRAEEQAILIGANTAIADNPMLDTRLWQGGRDPVRILIDPTLRVPLSQHIFRNSETVLIYNIVKDHREHDIHWIKVSTENMLPDIMKNLHTRQIASLLVEGGTHTLQSFMDAGLWNEARVFTSPIILHDGLPAPTLSHHPFITEMIDRDTLNVYVNSPA